MKGTLCIGEALIDMVCTDKGKKLSEGQTFLKKAGGAPTNVAAAIGALGGNVDLVVKVGNDPFGDFLRNTLLSFGVPDTWILRDADHFTTLAFVSLMENGERDFYFNRGADGYLSSDDLADLDITNYRITHFGSATAFLEGPLQFTYRDVLSKAQQNNCFISFDPNYRHLLYKDKQQSFIRQTWHFLGACHLFKMSDEEAMLVTGSDELDQAIKILSEKTKAVFAVTLGAEGTILRVGETVNKVISINVKVVDTTGAGDAFMGALLYQLGLISEKQDILTMPVEQWKQIVFNANIAGAKTCEYFGAMEAFSNLQGSFELSI